MNRWTSTQKKIDEMDTFDSDEEAVRFVKGKAFAGAVHCIAALQMTGIWDGV